MSSHVGDRDGKRVRCRCDNDDRPRQFDHIDVHLQHAGAAHCDRHGVLAGIARLGANYGNVMVVCFRCVMGFGDRMRMLMRRRAMVMLGMIVADVLVDMERRARGECEEQRLDDDERGEATHEK